MPIVPDRYRFATRLNSFRDRDASAIAAPRRRICCVPLGVFPA